MRVGQPAMVATVEVRTLLDNKDNKVNKLNKGFGDDAPQPWLVALLLLKNLSKRQRQARDRCGREAKCHRSVLHLHRAVCGKQGARLLKAVARVNVARG